MRGYEWAFMTKNRKRGREGWLLRQRGHWLVFVTGFDDTRGLNPTQ